MHEWISVEDKLPKNELREYRLKYPSEDAVEVIVMIRGAKEATVLLFDGEGFFDLCDTKYPVTHWMPLPEPPKEDKPC